MIDQSCLGRRFDSTPSRDLYPRYMVLTPPDESRTRPRDSSAVTGTEETGGRVGRSRTRRVVVRTVVSSGSSTRWRSECRYRTYPSSRCGCNLPFFKGDWGVFPKMSVKWLSYVSEVEILSYFIHLRKILRCIGRVSFNSETIVFSFSFTYIHDVEP